MGLERALEEMLEADTRFGFISRSSKPAMRMHPRVVVNRDDNTMLRTLRDELRHCESFVFSVAFVSPRAIALLKQDLVEFKGRGLIVTSDYLGFNNPRAFAELLALRNLGIDVRIHPSRAYHPKGYVFGYRNRVTAILGSSNLTANALVSNYEWNLKVTASLDSDLAQQFQNIVDDQYSDSAVLTSDWLDAYAATYVPPARGARRAITIDLTPPPETHWPLSDGLVRQSGGGAGGKSTRRSNEYWDAREDDAHVATVGAIKPNVMQQEALDAIASLRARGEKRAIVISATGTGKTILSALDVRQVMPQRMLYIAHREQILDRAMTEYQRVLGSPASDFGKLSGATKDVDRRFTFATIQTLSRKDVLDALPRGAYDYVLIDEVHRAGAETYRRVIDHFDPQFLLGMTATPERTDGFNLFELFNYNVAYEIRLGQALEAGMLAPFHYYGVTDLVLDSGETLGAEEDLSKLVSDIRVDHIVRAVETYGQAGIKPRGLVFCSRVDEARQLSEALNSVKFRGSFLKTVALSGQDSPDARERAVGALEAGELDYILTVDVFNEGVDIPSVNQVIMLRQTQSAIVFVQQLGRGLRLSPGKEYLVVIDFIGNYANNYMIPIALFGDDSLNKESLRKNLVAAEESGVLPGLSSVRFDRIARERVLQSIAQSSLNSIKNLKSAIDVLQARLGRVPALLDFVRFESADPVVVATRSGTYPSLLERVAGVTSRLTESERQALALMSSEILGAKRLHETVLLKLLLERGSCRPADIREAFAAAGLPDEPEFVSSAIRSLGLDFYTEQERKRYGAALVEEGSDGVSLADSVRQSLLKSSAFRVAVEDLTETALRYIPAHYAQDRPFTPGRQYSRKDSCRLLNWPSNVASTIYGYKVDWSTNTCPIFVTYHKDAGVSASTAYADELIDRQTMLWYTRSRRTLASTEVDAIVRNQAELFVFAKKDDAEGSDFYFLGAATARNAEETTMAADIGEALSVVRIVLELEAPIDAAVYDYFHPVVTDGLP